MCIRARQIHVPASSSSHIWRGKRVTFDLGPMLYIQFLHDLFSQIIRCDKSIQEKGRQTGEVHTKKGWSALLTTVHVVITKERACVTYSRILSKALAFFVLPRTDPPAPFLRLASKYKNRQKGEWYIEHGDANTRRQD